MNRRDLFTAGGAAALGLLGASVVAASPAAAAGFGYTPVSPYRTFDSRSLLSSKLPATYFVDFDVLVDMNGTPRIPSYATAVTFNLTVTQTEGNGWLLVWPGGGSIPSVSSINWIGAGVTLANGGTVGLGTTAEDGPGSIAVGCNGTSTAKTHFIVDITGYYS